MNIRQIVELSTPYSLASLLWITPLSILSIISTFWCSVKNLRLLFAVAIVNVKQWNEMHKIQQVRFEWIFFKTDRKYFTKWKQTVIGKATESTNLTEREHQISTQQEFGSKTSHSTSYNEQWNKQLLAQTKRKTKRRKRWQNSKKKEQINKLFDELGLRLQNSYWM